MKRKLLVHIGLPKAGSTSIQAMLAEWPAFFERAGVHVAVAGRQAGSHSQLYGDDGEPKHSAWDDLLRELTRCAAPRFVISWEPFAANGRRPGDRPRSSGSCASDIAALAKAADVDVEVVAYVRPQYQYLESLYVEGVKMARQTTSFAAAIEQYLQSPTFDYNWVFKPWRDTFGDRIVIVPLERTRTASGVLGHFLSVVGAVDPALAEVRLRKNPRIGAKHVEVLRLAGAALAALPLDRRARSARLDSLRLRVPALLAADLPFAGLTAAQVASVGERFAASNARFAGEYGIDPDGVLFRQPDDGLARPAIADKTNFSEVERTRLCRLIDSVLGEDVAEAVAASLDVRPQRRPNARRGTSSPPHRTAKRPGALPAWSRQRSAWTAVHAFLAHLTRLHRRARRVCRQARSIRDYPSMVAFLRWLRWELEVRCRRLPCWFARTTAGR